MLNDNIRPFRVKLSHYERIHSWLSLLLDCYAVIDFSVNDAISKSEKKIACQKECSACCHQTIPLSTIEAIGLKFYTQEILSKEARLLLINDFNKQKSICLFNVDGCCTIYKVRPIACRRYIVSSECCQLGEDPTSTRPTDVLEPSREYLYSAIALTLPFYEAQGIALENNEHIFDFYKKQNVKLSSIYNSILSL